MRMGQELGYFGIFGAVEHPASSSFSFSICHMFDVSTGVQVTHVLTTFCGAILCGPKLTMTSKFLKNIMLPQEKPILPAKNNFAFLKNHGLRRVCQVMRIRVSVFDVAGFSAQRVPCSVRAMNVCHPHIWVDRD